MNGKKLRKLATGAIGVVVATSVIGCSSTSSTTDSKGGGDSNKPMTLEWLTYQYGPVDNNAPIKQFLENKFNVKFNVWYMDVTKRQDLLGAKLAAGQIPDLMTVYSDADLQKFHDQGVTTTFSEQELEQYMPHYKQMIDKYDPKIWMYAKRKDGFLGIPALNVPDGELNKAVVWRKDWLDKLGITKVPETLDEFKNAVYKIRNNDPDGNGKKDTYGMSQSAMMDVYGAYGVYPEFWTVRDGKIVWSGILPETKQALQTLSQWKKDGVIDPEWVTGENHGGYWGISTDFVNSKIGVSSHGESYHWTIRQYDGGWQGQNIDQLNSITQGKAQIEYGPPPKGPDGKFGNILSGTSAGTYLAFGKNADPAKKHKIMQILDSIYGDFNTWEYVRYGKQGVNWDVAPDGVTIVMKDGFKKPDEMAKIGAHITFAPFAQPDFQAKVTNPKMTDFSEKNFHYQGAGYENAVKTALPSDPKYSKSLIDMQEAAFSKIINGDVPLSYFDTFVEQWKKQGGDQLTKEANDWYSSLAQ